MTKIEKENIIVRKLIIAMSDFDLDNVNLLLNLDLSGEQIDVWKKDRDEFRKVKNLFDDFLLVRSGKEPVFGEYESGAE